MKGWFDLWREDGGPTLYSHSNRSSVSGDVTTVTVCIVFGTLYAAFFVVFPGVRNEVIFHVLQTSLGLLMARLCFHRIHN
jgi:dual oxidase maturation factor 1